MQDAATLRGKEADYISQWRRYSEIRAANIIRHDRGPATNGVAASSPAAEAATAGGGGGGRATGAAADAGGARRRAMTFASAKKRLHVALLRRTVALLRLDELAHTRFGEDTHASTRREA